MSAKPLAAACGAHAKLRGVAVGPSTRAGAACCAGPACCAGAARRVHSRRRKLPLAASESMCSLSPHPCSRQPALARPASSLAPLFSLIPSRQRESPLPPSRPPGQRGTGSRALLPASSTAFRPAPHPPGFPAQVGPNWSRSCGRGGRG